MKRPLFLLASILVGGLIFTSVSRSDYISVLAEDVVETIFLGDKVTVENKTLVHGSDYQTVSGKIITPNGNSYAGREFTAKEHGQYKVVYEALFGSYKETKTITYLCQRRSSDYFTVDGGTKVSYGDFRYNTKKYSHSGVIFDVKNGSQIKFNEPLDMNDFLVPQPIESGKTFRDPSMDMYAHSLIDFLVDPSKQYETDFTQLVFTLTDTEDPFNYVEIRLKDAGVVDYRSGALSYARVGASGGFLAGWEFGWGDNPGHFHYTSSGTGIAVSFRGQPYQELLHSGNFLLDYSNQRFYTYPGSLSHTQAFFMNDLDDPDVYKKNIWSGFKNKKCYLTITPTSFDKSSGRLIIKSVGKINLNNEVLADDVAPTINVDYQGYAKSSLPKAVVGKYYPLFTANVTDNYDSSLTYDVSVTYRDTVNAKDIDVSVKNNAFLAGKSGTYTVTYTAKDRSGNQATNVIYKVSTVDAVDNINLSLAESSQSIPIYSEATIPTINDVTAIGGTGNVNIERTIIGPNNEEVIVNGNKFTPTLLGDYVIKFTGADYIGNTGEANYTLTSIPLDKPGFLNEPNLPPVLISGFTYSFDQLSAVETINNNIKILDTSITINGQPYNDSVVASGTSMEVKYIATGESGTSSYSVDVPVVDVSDNEHIINQAKYFYGGNAIENQDDVTLVVDSEFSTTFANKLDANNFYILFEREGDEFNFERVELKLTDVSNKNSSITFSINPNEEKFDYPDAKDVDFSLYDKELSLSFKNNTASIFDTQNKERGMCTIDDDGNEFNGYYQGVYLTISFIGVTGSTNMKIKKINNQPMGYKDGTGDRMEPIINLNSSFISEQMFGAEFVYPTFEAFDVLSEIESLSMRIVRPNGTPIAGDNHLTETFTIEEYGAYSVIYQAKDTSYNNASLTKRAFVYDDIKPELSVGKLAKTEYKVGAVVKIPSYTASDNIEGLCVDVILILPTNEMRILTHEENGQITYALVDTALYNSSFINDKTSFKTEIKGHHILRYVAYDTQFNTTIVELPFEVK